MAAGCDVQADMCAAIRVNGMVVCYQGAAAGQGMYVRICVDTIVDMCVDMCINMHRHAWAYSSMGFVCGCLQTCVHECVQSFFVGMYANVCEDMRVDLCMDRCVNLHVKRRSRRAAHGEVGRAEQHEAQLQALHASSRSVLGIETLECRPVGSR